MARLLSWNKYHSTMNLTEIKLYAIVWKLYMSKEYNSIGITSLIKTRPVLEPTGLCWKNNSPAFIEAIHQ